MTPSRIIIRYNGFGRIAKRLPEAVGRIVRRTAHDVRLYAIMAMAGIKSGRVYRRGKRVHHVASAPGEAPAVDTGKLRGSVFVERQSQTSAIVGVGAEYGAYLESGTRRIAPRPFMRPSAEKAARWYFEALKRLEGSL